MAAPLVSVLLPVFNGEVFLDKAIQSIQDQTFANWELVIIDDGSSDKSFEKCQAIAARDRRIRLFSNETNQGLAWTMNRLVSLAQGKYLAIQEQDDFSLPERISKEVSVLESTPNAGLVSGVAAWIDDQGTVFNHFPGTLYQGIPYPESLKEMVRYLYIEQCKVANAASMFRQEIITLIPHPFDTQAKMSIDWQFFIHVAHRYRIVGIPNVLVKMYRGRQHSHLSAKKKLQFDEARRCINLIYEQYRYDPASPVNANLWRQAMVTQLVLEGRYYGRLKGLRRLLQAFILMPGNKQVHKAFKDLGRKAINKLFN